MFIIIINKFKVSNTVDNHFHIETSTEVPY